MRFDRDKNPALCASKDATRYSTQGAAIVRYRDNDYIAATDGRKLTFVRCTLGEDDKPTDCYPAAAFDAARKSARKGSEAIVGLNGHAKAVSAGSTVEFQALPHRFPDVVGVVPKDPAKWKVILDARHLADVQKALGCSALSIEVTDPDSVVMLRPVYLEGGINDGSFAVVMPVSAT